MHELIEDSMSVVKDVTKPGEINWGRKATKAGYMEWADNHDLKELFEDIYDVKESFKALAMSRMARRNNQLGMKTLSDPHFKKMWTMFLKDMDVKGCRQL